MENLTDEQLWQILTNNQTAIFITCIAILFIGLAIYLGVSNWLQIARMKTDYENHIEEMNKFNERKTFK